jgi:DNA-directed RNA polymerase subunit RPC12/RpoP
LATDFVTDVADDVPSVTSVAPSVANEPQTKQFTIRCPGAPPESTGHRTMKKRFTFKCWNCPKTYTLFREITDEQVLTVACPYCNEEGVVILKIYPKKKVILRGEGEAEQQIEEPELPEILPTQKPEAKP